MGTAHHNDANLIWKEVLCRGRQCDARGHWFTIGPRDIADGLRNAQLMLSRGVPVPGVWEHQDIEAGDAPLTDAQRLAEWKRRYAKFTFGHIAGARVNDRGNLDLAFHVPDPADRKQLLKSKFCSPKLYPSYSDSRGGRYAGTTVAHVAATPTPVQFWQRPFGVELSRAGALYLSFKPGADMADDKAKEGDAGGGGTGEMGALIDALRAAGMTTPDEVKDIAGLIIAVKASGGANGGAGDTDLDDDFDLDTPGDTAAAPGAPVMMSVTHPDANVRRIAQNWDRSERRELNGRIKSLFQSGRCTRPEAIQLKRLSGSVELSFTKDAEPVSPLHKKLAELEKRPANSAWKATAGQNGGIDLSATRTFDAPGALQGPAAGEPDPAVIQKQEELARRMSASRK